MYLAPSAAQVLALDALSGGVSGGGVSGAVVSDAAQRQDAPRDAAENDLSVEAREAVAYHRAADRFMAAFRALATFIRRKQVNSCFFFVFSCVRP